MKYFLSIYLIYFLSLIFRLPLLQNISGIVIYSFLPGFYLNKLIGFEYKNIYELIGFSISSSISLIIFIFLALGQKITFNPQTHITIIISLNLLLLLLNLLLSKNNKNKIATKIDWKYFLISLLPLILLAIRSLTIPYLVDQDGFGYTKIMEEIDKTSKDTSFLYPIRVGFSYLVMSFHYVTGFNFIDLFKNIFPGLIWFSTIITGPLNILFLASPSLISHIDRFKPETISFMFELPVILLFIKSLSTNKIKYYFLGLFYCFIAYKSHDTGFLLLLVYSLSSLILVSKNFSYLKSKLKFKNLIFFSIILFPYFLIFDFYSLILSPTRFFRTFFTHGLNLHFQWWFLNSYNSIGMSTGWSDWRFILFYAYNGIFIFLTSFYLINKKIFNKQYKTLWPYLPVLLLVFIYFTISEILPRFGLFILPDRAWNHLFTFSTIFLIITSFQFKNKIIKTLLILNIICSITVSFVLLVFGGSIVSNQETPLIQQLNKLPQNSIILSTQKFNDILVKEYGQKTFLFIDPLKLQLNNFESLKLSALSQWNKKSYDICPNPNITKIIEDIIRTTTLNNTTGSKISEDNITNTNIVKCDQDIFTNANIYILYSFAKTDGLMSILRREYWLSGIDYQNKDFFKNINESIIFKDNSTTLIKIN